MSNDTVLTIFVPLSFNCIFWFMAWLNSPLLLTLSNR